MPFSESSSTPPTNTPPQLPHTQEATRGFALTKQAFYTPILERTIQLAVTNARVVDAWLQQHTYDTIRAYLEKTVGRK